MSQNSSDSSSFPTPAAPNTLTLQIPSAPASNPPPHSPIAPSLSQKLLNVANYSMQKLASSQIESQDTIDLYSSTATRNDPLYLKMRLIGHKHREYVKSQRRNAMISHEDDASLTYDEWRKFLLRKILTNDLKADANTLQADFKREQFYTHHSSANTTPNAQLASHARTYSMSSFSRMDTSFETHTIDDLSRTSMDEVSTDISDTESSKTGSGSRIPKYLAPTTVQEAYSFVGIHHLFEDRGQILRMKFANYEKGRVAWSTSRGVLVIAKLDSEPPQKLFTLQGHKKAIMDFDWSMSNEYIVSVSLDGHIKIWDTNLGRCIRTVDTKEPLSVCAFHPVNNNRFIVGAYGNTHLCWYNTSTGLKLIKFKLKNAVTALCFTPQGDMLILGDSKSYIYIYTYDEALKMKRRCAICIDTNKKPITSISFSSFQRFAKERSNLLLVNNCSDSVKLFRINMESFNISFKSQFPIVHKSLPVRSTFCPLISFRMGAVFVTGSECSMVKVFDLTKDSKSNQFLNQLSAHTAPVLDVCWNFNETLLGSCDSKGTIVFWKREKIATSGGEGDGADGS